MVKLYHVGSDIYDELKTKAQQGEEPNRFNTKISMLLTPISPRMLEKYIRHGFKPWEMSKAYMYVVDSDDLKYTRANIESIPEQMQYDLEHWEKDLGGYRTMCF